MILDRDKMPAKPLEIDLRGPEGNIYVLMGYARNFAKQIYGNKHPGVTSDERESLDCLDELTDGKVKVTKNLGEYICNRMMESHYEHALEVFEEYFGDYVILWK